MGKREVTIGELEETGLITSEMSAGELLEAKFWVVEPLCGDYAGKVAVLSMHETEKDAMGKARGIMKARQSKADDPFFGPPRPISVVKVLETLKGSER